MQTVVSNEWMRKIHEAVIQVKPGVDVLETSNKVQAYFKQKYGKSGQFSVSSDSKLLAQMKKFLNIFTLLLTSIALLSLVVGGIGINNMMLVSVSERLREFGIRKALGATNRSVRMQVLLESFLLCLTAGLIGVFLGFMTYEALIFLASQLIKGLKFAWLINPLAIVLSFVSIVAVGLASGFIPALKAEKLQIIEALRSE
jgi:putative ABC transport system permease protein